MRPLAHYASIYFLLCLAAIPFILTDQAQNYTHKFNKIIAVVNYRACVQSKIILIVVMKLI